MQTFTTTATGSTSIRLVFGPQAVPGATYTVYRGTTAIYGSATAISGVLAQTDPWYNDYAASPATTYYYWLVDQNSNVSGPGSATTLASQVNQDALDEPQMNALFAWAWGVWQGLYTTYWRYQPVPQPYDPKIILNCTTITDHGGTDWMDPYGEALIGSRTATITVLTSSNPVPATRYLAANTNGDAPGTGTYSLTVTLNGVVTTFSTTFATTPTNGTAVSAALIALMQDDQTPVAPSPVVTTGLNAWLVGTDLNNQQIAVEALDPSSVLVVAAGTNMQASSLVPPKAIVLAQRLFASLNDPGVIDQLSAAGIGVGDRHAVQDVSAMLETSAELVASFDFYINLAEVYPINPGVIDTVQAGTGTFVT